MVVLPDFETNDLIEAPVNGPFYLQRTDKDEEELELSSHQVGCWAADGSKHGSGRARCDQLLNI